MASSPWILVTNDDGVDSPALFPLMRRLETVAPVRAVVPAAERSWASKKMSRFERLHLRRAPSPAGQLWLLDGYPADCANLGIHRLGPERPALVVSGINVGANAGLAYFLSSGTVGAAVEGHLSGVPGLASSLQLANDDYRRWRRERRLTGMESTWEAAAAVTGQIAAEILAGGLPQGADLLNVNLPPAVAEETPRRFVGLTRTGYGSFFKPEDEPGCFAYGMDGLAVEGADGTGDIEALERGEVAMTAIRFALERQPAGGDRRRFERP